METTERPMLIEQSRITNLYFISQGDSVVVLKGTDGHWRSKDSLAADLAKRGYVINGNVVCKGVKP